MRSDDVALSCASDLAHERSSLGQLKTATPLMFACMLHVSVLDISGINQSSTNKLQCWFGYAPDKAQTERFSIPSGGEKLRACRGSIAT